MITRYAYDYQVCEYCGQEIYTNHYCIEDENGFYCDEDCHYSDYKKATHAIEVYLTNEGEKNNE